MNKIFVRKNITSFSILLFITLFGMMVYIKPTCVFNKDGTMRQFGIGYRNKTVIFIFIVFECLYTNLIITSLEKTI
jgi:hypothetical protein